MFAVSIKDVSEDHVDYAFMIMSPIFIILLLDTLTMKIVLTGHAIVLSTLIRGKRELSVDQIDKVVSETDFDFPKNTQITFHPIDPRNKKISFVLSYFSKTDRVLIEKLAARKLENQLIYPPILDPDKRKRIKGICLLVFVDVLIFLVVGFWFYQSVLQ